MTSQSQSQCYTIGIDVGGTNTDCVVLRGTELIGWAKQPTSENVTSRVTSALSAALQDACTHSGVNKAEIIGQVVQVNIGTTHFVNAVVQRRCLAPVAAIRLCGPASRALPPFIDFPQDLASEIQHSYHLLDGGFRFDGKEVVPVNDQQVISCINKLQQDDPPCKNIVIVGLFSSLNGEQEEHAAQVIQDHCPNVSVTLSHQVGHSGLLERENAAILNESLKPLASETVLAFRYALDSHGLRCPFYLTQNDGTLISAERAMKFPVVTFASGPTNSMRGAAFLSKESDAIVIDIGGTTTDVGIIRNGFPREASSQVKIGGVSTNFRMPDILSIGLGGGSLVDVEACKVGPVSVGYKLNQEAEVFGGKTLTATDIAVMASMTDIGTCRPASNLNPDVVSATVKKIHCMVEEAADRVKVTNQNLPVLLVGGGSILIDSSQPFTGASSVSRPLHYGVANAVGAALSQVSGSVDYVVSLDQTPRDTAISESKQRAVSCAIQAGAAMEAVGDLALRGLPDAVPVATEPCNPVPGPVSVVPDPDIPIVESKQTDTSASDHPAEPPDTPKSKHIDITTGDWIIDPYDIECIAVGAGILGCGGGGSPLHGRLRCLEALKQGYQIRVINSDRLDRLSGLIAPVAFMGAPTIAVEMVCSGKEVEIGLSTQQKLLNAVTQTSVEAYTKSFGGGRPTHPPPERCGITVTNPSLGIYCPASIDDLNQSLANTAERQICAVVSCEIGGANSMEPLIIGAERGIPVVDADGMGRAFPELQMFTPSIYGAQLGPCCLIDDMGECVSVTHAETAKQLENFMRDHTIRMGCSAAITFGSLSVSDVQQKMVQGSLSRAWQLGQAVLDAQCRKLNPINAILGKEAGKVIVTGKIVDVSRQTSSGFSKGFVLIEGFGEHSGQTIQIELQNEFLIARPQLTKPPVPTYGPPAASVPDLITLIDTDTGFPITTEDARYGMRVTALVLASQQEMRTAKALEVVGPQAFGYKDVKYHPIEEELARQ